MVELTVHPSFILQLALLGLSGKVSDTLVFTPGSRLKTQDNICQCLNTCYFTCEEEQPQGRTEQPQYIETFHSMRLFTLNYFYLRYNVWVNPC